MIKRDRYLNRLIHNMWNGEIKVITGIRRCGKSVLLFDLFYEYLLSQGISEDHIIRLELDQRRYYKFRNPIVLCEYVESLIKERSEERFFLFVDEVQFTAAVKDEANGGIEVTIYDKLNELGIEPLYDDRDERPGVKFKDMELIGIPMRITVGKLAGENKVEFRLRTESENTVLTVDEAIAKVTELCK